MSKSKSGVTLPGEAGFAPELRELALRWGADAVRDSDGTRLDSATLALGLRVYCTYFVSRGHNDFAKKHPDERQRVYLMSRRTCATGDAAHIRIMDGYFSDQLEPDSTCDITKYWEVRDRSTDAVIPSDKWTYDKKSGTVTVTYIIPYHEYTVSFLAFVKWDPTQLYNCLTNGWTDTEHDIPFDVRHEASWEFAKSYLKKWLGENRQCDVVRFTTFFYHFTLMYDDRAREKYVDWFGYSASVSVAALEAFEAEYGYSLTPEDFVDGGCYNSPFRTPSRHFLDYIDFTSRFVAGRAAELVKIVHDTGREAMMFLGDNWIGTEPYGRYWKNVGVDAVVGSVGSGATLRMISDIPHVKYTEGRFLPYFFPDTFHEGGDPCGEATENWVMARRALMRSPLARIGYGGYPSLAYKFPEFVDLVAKICAEFRDIRDKIGGSKPYSAARVAVLNSWGRLRSWQTHMIAHAKPYRETSPYLGVLEALSGMAVDVTFLSFDDILKSGIPSDIDVIINAGDGGTAFSGGDVWRDGSLVAVIRKWVYGGGGFVGIGEPSAADCGDRYFQLADVLGVDRERGFTLSSDKYCTEVCGKHFITDGIIKFYFGESVSGVYALSDDVDILDYNGGVRLAANTAGMGRAVYIAGVPYSSEMVCLLRRSILYAASRESEETVYCAKDISCEVHAYPGKKIYAVVNNSNEPVTTEVYDGKGHATEVSLGAGGIVWKEIT